MSAKRRNLLGVDIGGTFTDVAYFDRGARRWHYGKVLTTYPDFERGVMEAIGQRQVDLSGIEPLVHGTTIVTNTIIESKGSRVGLITTRGFADVLEIARSDKAEPYGHAQDKFGPGRPEHLVPKNLRLEVTERIGSDGSVIVDLDQEGVQDAIDRLRGEGIDVVAVSLMNSYVNPVHEERIKKVFASRYSKAAVHLSSEVSPTVREYERTSTVVVNAYVARMTEEYVADMISSLRGLGYRYDDISVMTSAGGVVDSGVAKLRPILLVESGPAAGVIAARDLAAAAGIEDVISFDMGGTTAKASLIDKGKLSFSNQYKVAAISGHTIGQGPQGGGYTVNIVVTDIAEVGAGGGSIGWVDIGGALQVGPQSATSNPGPACYGFGGTEPTVTDANLILGRINPSGLAGGYLKLKKDLAEKAVRERVGRGLGLSAVDAALGMIEIVNTNMVKALRIVSLERGYDPREYVMVAFGSAAPQHAAWLADELMIPRVIIPREPGCFSAKGLVIAEPRRDVVQTYVKSLDQVNLSDLRQKVEHLKQLLLNQSTRPEARGSFKMSFEARYPKQGWEITVSFEDANVDEGTIQTLWKRFELLHQRQYGYHFERVTPIVVSIRLSLIHKAPTVISERVFKGGRRPAKDSEIGSRRVFFSRKVGSLSTPVLDRSMLAAGNAVEGPALIDEAQSTTVVPPGHECRVDAHGNLVIGTLPKRRN